MLDFGLVREALRGARPAADPARAAPGPAGAVPLPAAPHAGSGPYVGAGLALYDAMAMLGKYDMGVPRHRHLFRKQVARIAPDLRTEDLTGAIRYYDCQVDDARLVLTIARTAAVARRPRRHPDPGRPASCARASGSSASAPSTSRPARELEVRARVVVNAAGVWTDEIQEMVGGRGSLHVQASKGIHLVVPRDRIRSEAGFITRTETSVLFVIPWGRHWIIGTTDTAWNLDKAHPAASRADIDYLLDHVNAILREPLDHEDVEGVYAGLRPLLSGESEPTSRISREHTVVTPVPGLVMIAGGKLTTYRVMAKDAVDAAVDSLRTRQAAGPRLASPTGCRWPAPRASRPAPTSGCMLAAPVRPAPRADRPPARPATAAWSTTCSTWSRARPELAEPLEGAEDYLAAEVVYAVTHEGARHLDDVLTRRTRISIETFDRGIHAARPAAELMAGELGWDAARTDDEVDHYLRRVEAERQCQLDAHRPGGRRGPGQRPRHRVRQLDGPVVRGAPWRQDRRQQGGGGHDPSLGHDVTGGRRADPATVWATSSARSPVHPGVARDPATIATTVRRRAEPRPSRPLSCSTEDGAGPASPRAATSVHAPRRGRLLGRRRRLALGPVTEIHDHLVWCTS